MSDIKEYVIIFVDSKNDIHDLTGVDLANLIEVATDYHHMKRVLEIKTIKHQD